MTDALFPCAGVPGARTSVLRELVDLVNEAVRRSVTPPSPAGPSIAAGPSVMRQAALETTPPPRTSLLGSKAARALRPAPSPRPGPGGAGGGEQVPTDGGPPAPQDAEPTGPDNDSGSAEMEETHAETWRLVRLAQAGDGDAFGGLYDRYVDIVFRFIYFRVNDRTLAEDFTSETFLRALRRIGTISYQGRDIGAWFITIARNIVLDHMKSARHRLEVTTADTIEGREHTESTESAVLQTLQSERLMKAVAELGAEQRECVMLRFIQGLSVSETAAVMGKNDGAIKALQHRAVRKLADLVGQELR